MADRRELTIAFRAEVDLADWNARYERGLVPDLFPYGLQKLERSGFDVAWAGVPAVSSARKAALTARPSQRRSDGEWAIAWDEFSAVRMFAGVPRARYATGVIWASDEAGRGLARRTQASLIARTLTAADLVWVLSTAQVPVLRRIWGTRAPRIEYVPFGIAADFFTPAPHPDRPAVLSLGNDRDRDLDTLLAAFQIVHRERPDVRLRVQSKSEATFPVGVERVPFLSHAELRDLYHDTTVVALSTRPNLHVSGMTTILEAMSTSRGVVATRSPGIEDYVGEATGGFLVPQSDASALAGGILEALEPGTAVEMGALGRSTVERRFTTDLLASRLGALLI